MVLSSDPVLCVAILGSDVGQNRSENVGDHKLASDLAKNRSENSPSRPKTGRRFSVSDLSPTVNAKAEDMAGHLPGSGPYAPKHIP